MTSESIVPVKPILSAARTGQELRISTAQCLELGKAGGLGVKYEVATSLGNERVAKGDALGAAPTVYFDAETVADRAKRNRWSKAQLLERAEANGYEFVIVLRQKGFIAETGDPTRDWYGMDYYRYTSGILDHVSQQEEASRKWWKLNTRRRLDFANMRNRGGKALLVCSVAGLILMVRNVDGLDDADPGDAYIAFSLAQVDSCFEDLELSWLASGPGPALIIWNV